MQTKLRLHSASAVVLGAICLHLCFEGSTFQRMGPYTSCLAHSSKSRRVHPKSFEMVRVIITCSFDVD